MKEKLLKLVDVGGRMEANTLVPQVDDSEPDVAGLWTAKDNLAHLSAWRDVAIGDLDSVLRGSPVVELAETDDEQNAKFYMETHAIPARSVLERASRSWNELAGRLLECTEEQLQSPRPRHPDQQLWEAVPGNSFGHLAEHLGYWYSERGDEAAAENIALWACEFTAFLRTTDRDLGTAEYNLGCFYAKRGRAADALPHLRKGIELRPDLRAWAEKTQNSIRFAASRRWRPF